MLTKSKIKTLISNSLISFYKDVYKPEFDAHTHKYAGSSSAGGAATSANKVNTNLAIKLNSGTTEGTNLFTFNGSTAKTINITPSAIGAAASSHGTHIPATCTSVTDWNNATSNGWYMGNNAANQPVASGGWFYGQVIAHNSNFLRQILYHFASNNDITGTGCNKYERVKHNGTWGAWYETTVRTAVPKGAKFTDTVYTHPTTSGNKHIPSGGSSGQYLKYSADGTAVWDTVTANEVGAVSQTDFNNMTIGGRNLFIESKCSKGYIDSAGNLVVTSSYKTTDYIPVTAGEKIIFQVFDNTENIWYTPTYYDSKKAYISGYTSKYNQNNKIVEHYTIPSNTSFMKISVSRDTKCKIERGTKPTDWTPAPEDIEDSLRPLVIGTQTETTYTWTGNAPFNELKDGQRITYWLPYSSGGTQVTLPYWNNATGTTQQGTNAGTALNLTLADGTTTGNIACYYSGGSRLTTHFPQGNTIELTYRKLVKIGSYYYTGWWSNAFYNSDTLDDRISYFYGKTGTKGVWGHSLFMETKDGTYESICTASDGTITSSNRTTANTKKANTVGFKVNSSIYFSSSNYNANTTINGYGTVYSSYSSLIDSRYSLNTTLTANILTPAKMVYLVGTINDNNLFILDSTWWTQTPNDTSKVYVAVGYCYDSTTSSCRITLLQHNTWYKYDASDGLVEYSAYLCTNGMTTITKTLTVGTSWIDTGIAGDNLESGSYMVQISGMSSSATSMYSEIFTGTMSWYDSSTNSTESDEIILHSAGHAPSGRRLFLRTLRTASPGTLKLQIASTSSLSSSSYTFKFRKLI